MTLHNLGQVSLRRGGVREAASRFGEALQFARSLQDKRVVMLCLAGLAAVAAAEGRLPHAGRLLDDLGAPFEPVDRAVYERTRAAVRAGLGVGAAEAERATGRTLLLEQALEAALSQPEPAQAGTAGDGLVAPHAPLSPASER